MLMSACSGTRCAVTRCCFVRQDAVEAAWAIVEPILGHVTPVYEYAPLTWGPAEADRLASDIGGWHQPGAVMRVLVIDVGGTHVKVLATAKRTHRQGRVGAKP